MEWVEYVSCGAVHWIILTGSRWRQWGKFNMFCSMVWCPWRWDNGALRKILKHETWKRQVGKKFKLWHSLHSRRLKVIWEQQRTGHAREKHASLQVFFMCPLFSYTLITSCACYAGYPSNVDTGWTCQWFSHTSYVCSQPSKLRPF